MVNWWFGFVFWGSRCALGNNPFHKNIPNYPNHQPKPPVYHFVDSLNYIMTFVRSSSHHGFCWGGYMFVSKNNGIPCIPKSSILIGFSIINHPFCGTPIFGNTHYVNQWGGPSWVLGCMQDMVPELRGSEIYRHLLEEAESIGGVEDFNHQRHH